MKSEVQKTVLETIDEMYDKIFQAERKVADFVRRNPELVVNANVSELANYSGVSDATVVRLCKHLGYEGYYQMKICLSGDLGGTGPLRGRRNSSGTKTDYFRDIAEGILTTEAAVDEKIFNACAELIRNSTMVHLVGVGNTSPVCLYCGFRLERIGIRCTYDALPEYYMNHICLAPPTDVVLAISWSGTTRNVVSALRLAGEKGLKTMAVTAYMQSPVSRSADYLLLSALENGENNRSSQYSRINEMAVIEALIQAVSLGADEISEPEMWLSELKY
ncbi:MurR/RpiR family transcriptional regulator [Lachnospiraceae bacterium 48-42]|jgi:Transcriptional regulators